MAGAAACLVVGAGLGLLLPELLTPGVSGPPGTLGAIEHVDFEGEPDGVSVGGDLVAHTWGTETVLKVAGLGEGSYRVVVIDTQGLEHDSGAFLGSRREIDCRMNAAVLRGDVASVAIRSDSGQTVATAAVPQI